MDFMMGKFLFEKKILNFSLLRNHLENLVMSWNSTFQSRNNPAILMPFFRLNFCPKVLLLKAPTNL